MGDIMNNLINKLFYGSDEIRRIGSDLPLFHRSFLEINLRRLNAICMVLMVSETILLILPERAFNYHTILFPFLIVNGILLVILRYLMSKLKSSSNTSLLLIQVAIISNILFLASSLNLAAINRTDFVHPFIIALTFLGTGLQLTPILLTGMILTTTTLNLIGMGLIQTNSEVFYTAASNIVVFSVVAWILAIQVSRTRILGWINQQEILIQNAILYDLTKRDSMTRFFNHESILSHLKQEIEHAKATGDPLSVLLLDADDFKLVNDTHGHLKGDEVLMMIARNINLSVRVSDLIGRYGGEEFLVILPNTTLNDAMLVSDRIRSGIEQAGIGAGIKVTISGGIVLCEQDSVDSIIRKADDRLFKAKRSGKNKIVFD